MPELATGIERDMVIYRHGVGIVWAVGWTERRCEVGRSEIRK